MVHLLTCIVPWKVHCVMRPLQVAPNCVGNLHTASVQFNLCCILQGSSKLVVSLQMPNRKTTDNINQQIGIALLLVLLTVFLFCNFQNPVLQLSKPCIIRIGNRFVQEAMNRYCFNMLFNLAPTSCAPPEANFTCTKVTLGTCTLQNQGNPLFAIFFV